MTPDQIRAFLLHGTRTGKLAVAMANGQPRATYIEDPEETRRWATLTGGRYMGEERAEQFGRRNGVSGELLVRLTPDRVIAETSVAD